MFSSGKVELLLHAFDDRRQDWAGLGTIRLAKFDALDGPVRCRFGATVDPFNHDPDKPFTRWIGFPDSRDDRGLQLVLHHGCALVDRTLPVEHLDTPETNETING